MPSIHAVVSSMPPPEAGESCNPGAPRFLSGGNSGKPEKTHTEGAEEEIW